MSLCNWLDKQKINIVCNILCIFEDILQSNRDIYSNYFEVFLDTPLEVVVERDIKGIYKPAIKGLTKNVVGIDISFPIPKQPDYIYKNNMDEEPALIANRILDLVSRYKNE